VYVAVAGPPPDDVSGGRSVRHQGGVQVQELSLAGDRSAIRDQTTRAVLQLLLDRLQAGHPPGRSAPSGVET
jgi:hypothetical protein